MTLPYLQFHNLSVVPYVPQRLNFAVQVQQAFQNLELDPKYDAIVVGLPESIQQEVESAVAKLPDEISLIIAAFPDPQPAQTSEDNNGESRQISELQNEAETESAATAKKYREVFPVTPCDAAIEACRLAAEHSFQLHFIDQELAPNRLVTQTCQMDPHWPDDGLSLKLGAERYLKLIQSRVTRPPMRMEPIDSFRENFMARELQRLIPLYRKILLVVNVVNVPALQHLLGVESWQLQVNDSTLPQPELSTTSKLKPEILLNYLDDFPQLVEQFERHRRSGTGHRFDKLEALRNVIYQHGVLPDSSRNSARRHKSFMQYLHQLLVQRQRVSPRPQDVFEAGLGCFDKTFAQDLHHRLATFRDKISTEEIELINGETMTALTAGSASENEADQQDPEQIYYQRTCNPNPPTMRIVPSLMGNRNPTSRSFGWPPWKRHVNYMRRKSLDLAVRLEEKQRITAFRGSLEGGIERRRTLRSVWSGQPTIYVKERNVRRIPDSLNQEPVVWLFGLNAPSSCITSIRYIGPSGSPTHVSAMVHGTSLVNVHNDSNLQLRIQEQRQFGMVSFCQMGRPLDETRETYKEHFETQIPRIPDLTFISRRGYVAQPWDESARGGTYLWWELMLLCALKYARQTVVLCAPDGFRCPPSLFQFPETRGKQIVNVSPARFIKREREQLQLDFWLSSPLRAPDGHDVNIPAWEDLRERSYRDIMSNFWKG